LSANESFHRISENRRLFDGVLSKAKTAYQKEDYESALAWAKIGAHFAFIRHPGIYTNPILENLLLEIAQKVSVDPVENGLPTPFNNEPKGTHKKRFLHIMTESYGTGGHSPFIARWIENTKDNSVHSLITTAQKAPMPDLLTNSVQASGGFYRSLTELAPTLMEQTRLLRGFAHSWADVIVLFVHPFDPLPIVAFGREDGPPVLFCNHADHAFWLGTSIADVVFDYHPTATELCRQRRGIDQTKLLPIPLTEGILENKRNSNRSELGFNDTDIILLTIGREEKFLPFQKYDFLDTMVEVLRNHPNVKLVAVGPAQLGMWKKAAASVQNRIQAVGTVDRQTLEKYYDIADLYVASFPCGSGTSMLEAGLHGIPLLGLNIAELPHFSGSDDLAFRDSDVYESSVEGLKRKLECMIADTVESRGRAVAVVDSIMREHCSPGWNRYLEDVLGVLPVQHAVKNVKDINDHLDYSDMFWEQMSSSMLFNEAPENSISRLIRVYSNYLARSEVRSTQAQYLIHSFSKVNSLKRFRQFTRSFTEFINSA
jgi:hypothetical protein